MTVDRRILDIYAVSVVVAVSIAIERTAFGIATAVVAFALEVRHQPKGFVGIIATVRSDTFFSVVRL